MLYELAFRAILFLASATHCVQSSRFKYVFLHVSLASAIHCVQICFLAFVFSQFWAWISAEESHYIINHLVLDIFFSCVSWIYAWRPTEHAGGTSLNETGSIAFSSYNAKISLHIFLSFFLWTVAIIQLMSNHPIILKFFREYDFKISATKDQWLNFVGNSTSSFELLCESNVQTDIEVDSLSGDAQSWKDFGQRCYFLKYLTSNVHRSLFPSSMQLWVLDFVNI